MSEESNITSWNGCNLYKVRDQRQPVKLDELDTDKLRSEIEPWLTALFQSEHLSLLLGDGRTTLSPAPQAGEAPRVAPGGHEGLVVLLGRLRVNPRLAESRKSLLEYQYGERGSGGRDCLRNPRAPTPSLTRTKRRGP